MPKENYGRKGLSQKPNTNAENFLDEATDPINPREVEPTNEAAHRAADAPENEVATQRPQASKKPS
jgi:hypothetical protein